MGLRRLLRPLPLAARLAAENFGLLERLRLAAAAPPAPSRYVAPRLRTFDALAFAVRGYRVFWTVPTGDGDGRLYSSVLVYAMHDPGDGTSGEDGEPFEWCVELPTLLPGEIHRVSSWLVGARTLGWRFARWQAVREARWVMQRRKARER